MKPFVCIKKENPENYWEEGGWAPWPPWLLRHCNMVSNTFLDFISDIGVTDHRHYDR